MEDHESPDDCVTSHPGFHTACLNVCTCFKLQSTSTDNNTMKPFKTQQRKYSFIRTLVFTQICAVNITNIGIKNIK